MEPGQWDMALYFLHLKILTTCIFKQTVKKIFVWVVIAFNEKDLDLESGQKKKKKKKKEKPHISSHVGPFNSLGCS